MPRIRSTEFHEPRDPSERTGRLRLEIEEINVADKELILATLRGVLEEAMIPDRRGSKHKPRNAAERKD